jgi:hypothetical protein
VVDIENTVMTIKVAEGASIPTGSISISFSLSQVARCDLKPHPIFFPMEKKEKVNFS